MSQTTNTIVAHTPGPWHAGEPLLIGRYLVRDEDGEIVAEVPGLPWSEAETTANAALIAAAPDGLEAARFALSVLQANPIELSERMAIERLEAFISKAEGRTS